MDEEQTWLFIQHMAVDRRHLDVSRPQRTYQRVDLVASHQEIARDRSLAVAGRLKVDCVCAAKRARHLHSAFHDGIAAGHAELIDAAHSRALDADDLVERGSIEFDRRSGTGGGCRGGGRGGCGPESRGEKWWA